MVPSRFAGARRLDVDDAMHTLVDFADVVRTARLEGHLVAGIAKSLEQREAARLREGLAARHADMTSAVAGDVCFDLVEATPLPARERVSGVAIRATQRTARKANEHRGPTAEAGLALKGEEDLGDLQPRARDLHCACRSHRTQPPSCVIFSRRCEASRAAVVSGNWRITSWRAVRAAALFLSS